MEETCSLVHRLEEKYLEDDDSYVDQDIILTNFTGSSPCKMASKRALELIVLNHMNITHVGDTSRFASLVQHVAEVDLAWNIIDWDCVAILLKHLPHLRTLNLSHNPLKKEVDVDIPVIPYLHTLILNGTHISLSTLSKMLPKVPVLQELHISDNDLDICDDMKGPISDSIKTIYINRCGIKDWASALSLLRRFPSRKTAFLCENPIKSVMHNTSTEEFATLKGLNLGKTEISKWESIDNLDRLPGLTDLRLPCIPLLESYTAEERHHLVIGRMRNLRVLNGSVITPEQREQSERYFIRYYQDREDKPSHYKRLIEKHGHIERLAKVDLTPKSFASVQVICEETNYTAKLRINLNKNVGQLMKFLEKDCGITYPRMRMFLTTTDGLVEECRFHNMSLHSLRIEDGDVLNLQSKMVATRRRPLQKSSP